MQESHLSNISSTSITPAILSTATTETAPADHKTPLRTVLPTLKKEALVVGDAITTGDKVGLSHGLYAGQAVTLFQMPSSFVGTDDEAVTDFMHRHSPFWLPVLGVCEGTTTCVWVMGALPETRFDTWLTSSTSQSWVNRCRLVRDVAVGLYQRRALGVTHITWDTSQLYLDKDGRAQLAPLLSENR